MVTTGYHLPVCDDQAGNGNGSSDYVKFSIVSIWGEQIAWKAGDGY